MRYYTVAEITITDRGWVREYVATVTGLVQRYGGRYLARTSRFEKVEGTRPTEQLFLLIEWPSKTVADSFYESDDYRPYRERRLAGSRSESVLVAGEDVNNVAEMG
jgi:uncharacterized protein (DUF1330 family)